MADKKNVSLLHQEIKKKIAMVTQKDNALGARDKEASVSEIETGILHHHHSRMEFPSSRPHHEKPTR